MTRNRLRVLLVNTLYDERQVGGAERSVEELRAAIQAEGLDASVLTTLPPGEARRDEAGVVRVPMKRPYWPFSSVRTKTSKKIRWHVQDAWSLGDAGRLREILEEVRPDILHTHNLQGIGTTIWRVAKEIGIPVVHTLHDHSLTCPWQRCRAGKLCHRQDLECRVFSLPKKEDSWHVDHVIGVSEFILKTHQDLGFFAGATTSVVPNVPRSHPERSEQITRTMAIGFLGDLGDHKGVKDLIDAYPSTHAGKSGWPLLIGGADPADARQELEQGSPAGVRFLGAVDPADLLRSAQVIVVPSRVAEGFGRVAAEAAAWGRQVLISRRGGLPEAIEGYPLARTFDPDVPGDLAQQLDRLTQNPADEATMRLAADGFVRRRERVLAPGHIQVYDQLAGISHRASAHSRRRGQKRPSFSAPDRALLIGLALTMIVDVLAGPIRFLLQDHFWALVVPKSILAAAIIWKWVDHFHARDVPNPGVLFPLLAGAVVGIAFLPLRQFVIGAWFWIPLVAAASLAPAVAQRLPTFRWPMVTLWVLAVLGVAIDTFIDFPWLGLQVGFAGADFDVARWLPFEAGWTAHDERVAGFSTASYAAARHILISATLLLVLLPRRAASAMWALSGLALAMTTSRAALAAFAGVTLLVALLLLKKRWGQRAAVAGSAGATAAFPLLAWAIPAAYALIPDSGIAGPMLRSLRMRAEQMWIPARDLMAEDPWTFIVGRGIGGIGRAQDFVAEPYNAADNLFLYAYVQLGLFGIALLAVYVLRALRPLRTTSAWPALLATAVLVAGIFTSTIEDIFSSVAMGLVLGLAGPMPFQQLVGPSLPDPAGWTPMGQDSEE